MKNADKTLTDEPTVSCMCFACHQNTSDLHREDL